MYRMKPCEYDTLLKKAVHKDYKKAQDEVISSINNEAQEIIKNNNINGKIPKYEQKDCFITLKDHKEGFPNRINCRLLNPSKTHLGKISKKILDDINGSIRKATTLIQWKNTQDVLSWFEKIQDKSTKYFVKFDIKDFYPSIKASNIENALDFAASFTQVTTSDREIIMHTCKTLLFHDGSAWTKRNTSGSFDVPMGSFHGAELCELIGLFLLDATKNIFPTGDCGLYRDDGLGVVKKTAARNLTTLERSIRNVFKSAGFEITIESGLVVTEFLDITLDLKNDSHHPFNKPNNRTMYVNKRSNHPPHIKKAIPRMVHQRLCRLSKDKPAFDDHSGENMEQLMRSGYDVSDLEYSKPPTERKRRRKRNLIYFHPPFCSSVATKLGRLFRDLVDKHFNQDHKYKKILNKNSIKMSYSCLPNMKAIINSHNKSILNKTNQATNTRRPSCNCRNKDNCPLSGKCLVENIIYKAEVSLPNKPSQDKVYIGSTCNSFKKRFYGHQSSFKNNKNKTSTQLSTYIWSLKDKKIPFQIKWSIVNTSRQTTPSLKFCTICNLERIAIAKAKKQSLLNRRNELVTKCPHRRSLFF